MLEEAHRVLAGVCGELSLALVRGTGSRSRLLAWADRLRTVASHMETHARRAAPSPARPGGLHGPTGDAPRGH